MRVWFTILLLALALALPFAGAASAQDEADQKGFLEGWLQDNLSGAGRDVQVTGLSGALSSEASIEKLTIADDQGIWLTIEGASFEWKRSALLSGRLEISSATADAITVARRPVTGGGGPKVAASDFELPELPVAVDIGEISVPRVVLGPDILGEDVTLGVSGELRLEGGEGAAKLQIARQDGKTGNISLDGSYTNETRVLSLDLEVQEGSGLVEHLLGVPDTGLVTLKITGTDSIDDFTGLIDISGDGESRLAGQVTVMSDAAQLADGSTPSVTFNAALGGDARAFFQPEYRAFLGENLSLALAGKRSQDGRIEIDELAVAARALALGGSAVIAPAGGQGRARFTLLIEDPDGAATLLPVGGTKTWVQSVTARFDYDAANGSGWQGAAQISGLERGDISLGQAMLRGSGEIEAGRFGGKLDFGADGIVHADPAISAAVGPQLSGHVGFARATGQPLEITEIQLTGQAGSVEGTGNISADLGKLDLIASGQLRAELGDLSLFSGLAGRRLGGAAALELQGDIAYPGGPFTLTATGTGQDLALSDARFDRIFAGPSRIDIVAARDATGTRIDRLDLASAGAMLGLTGALTPEGGEGALQLDMPDAALLADGLNGPLSLSANATQTDGLWSVDANATGPGAATGHVVADLGAWPIGQSPISGTVTLSAENIAPYAALAGRDLAGGLALRAEGGFDPQTGAFDATGEMTGDNLALGLGVADPLIAGASQADFALARDADGVILVEKLNLTTPELTANATGQVDGGETRIDATARLADMGLIVPGLSGAFSGSGQGTLGADGWQVSGEGKGPGGTAVRVAGTMAADASTADLALDGALPLEFANPFIAPRQLSGLARFDLRLAGPLALSSLSGQITTSAARLSLPTLAMSLDPLDATATLSGGRATVDLTANSVTGGRVQITGPIGLTAPYEAGLEAQIRRLRLSNAELFDTRVTGDLTLDGPAMGGATLGGKLTLDAVELRVPESGFGVDGSLEGLQHVGEPAAVAATRARAGIVEEEGVTPGEPYYFDVLVEAPSRIFLRGRGIDAEFGGSLRLGGSSDAIAAEGAFELVRGRMDFLGNRLDLTEGLVTFRGSPDPYIRLVAETSTSDLTVTVLVEGYASEPVITFSSSPDLPQDEIVAQLVFGRSIDQISPLQAVKLASAIATLSGKGGAGMIGRLRQKVGLADLDVTTDEEGNVTASAGSYIGENVYTEVTVGADGETEIHLDLSITPDLTARGRLTQDGNTGLGVFYERDF